METRVCVWFQKGKCRNGSSCAFQHVQQERDGNVLVIRSLPRDQDESTVEAALRAHFGDCGYLARVQVKTDLNQRCRGFAFLVFADVCHADLALQLGHPRWDVKRKVDLPMFVEGEARPSRRCVPPSLPRSSGPPLLLPFSGQEEVLLVGEGNFSYTVAALSLGKLLPSQIVATSMEPPRSRVHLERLLKTGVECHTDVDATSLSAKFLRRFEVVMFNFPHTGQPSIEENQALLRGFFSCIARAVDSGGDEGGQRAEMRVAVTLKQTWPYTEWDVEGCAAGEGLRLLCSHPFPADTLLLHGYQHETTDEIPHQVNHLGSARTFEFRSPGATPRAT